MRGHKKDISQVDYLIDELKSERKALIKEKAEGKVDEFVKVLTIHPAKDEIELKRILMMLAQDLKNVYEY